MRMVQRAAAWVAGASLLAGATPSWPQDYPTREIRTICPFAPGTGADIVVRYYAAKVAGKPVITENRPCAQGLLGTILGTVADATVELVSNTTRSGNFRSVWIRTGGKSEADVNVLGSGTWGSTMAETNSSAPMADTTGRRRRKLFWLGLPASVCASAGGGDAGDSVLGACGAGAFACASRSVRGAWACAAPTCGARALALPLSKTVSSSMVVIPRE